MTVIRSVGDRVRERFSGAAGTITEVHRVPGLNTPNCREIADYSIDWAGGKHPGERWSEDDLRPAQ